MRLAGALLGLALVELLDRLGVWGAAGLSEHLVRATFALLGAALAPSSVGVVLWYLLGASVTLQLLVLYTPVTAPLIAGFVREDRPRAPVDAVVVFSGAVNSAGRVNNNGLERLLDALQVMQARRIGALGLSVVADERDPRTPSSERDQRRLVAMALPGLEPRFVRNVHSTRDEALAFAALARTHRWRRVLAITSPTHTRRACSALEIVGLDVECRPAAEREYDGTRLSLAGNRSFAFRDVVYETAATWIYRLRGWMR